MSARRGLHPWIDGRVAVRALAPLRIALGPILLLHLEPFLRAAGGGAYYADSFHQPFLPVLPTPPRQLYIILLLAAAAAAPLISLGLYTRAAIWYAASFVAWNLALSETHFHHNRFFLLILLIGVAALPSGAHLSLDAHRRSRRTDGAGWVLLAVRFELAVVYLASGFSKLIDPDWWGGTVLRIRVDRYSGELAERGLPDGLIDLITGSDFHWWFAKAVVITELFIGAGLVFRRSRTAAIWVAIPFHLLIELTAEVQIFTWAALAALVVWADPRWRDRRLTVPTARWALLVRALDWLGRFDIEVAAGPVALVDRDRTIASGREATLRMLTLLPLTFWLAAPLRALQRRRVTAS